MKIKAIVFDMGNVLVKYDFMIFLNQFEKICKKPRKEIIDVFLSAYSNKFDTGKISGLDFYTEIVNNLEINISFEDFKKMYCSIFLKNNDFKKYAEKIIDKYPAYILSNIDELHYEHIVNNFNWVNNIDTHFLSYEMGLLKPDEKIYKNIINNIKDYNPEEILFIDDKTENIEGAQKAGLKAIHYSSTEYVVSELKKYKILE